MEEKHNPAYAAWMTAETEAYVAIHGLHQSTCGARKPIPLAAMQKIVSLRRKADASFAQLRRELGMEEAVVAIPSPRDWTQRGAKAAAVAQEHTARCDLAHSAA